MALTRRYTLIRLSTTYDGLTIYIKHPRIAPAIEHISQYLVNKHRFIRRTHPDHLLYHSSQTELTAKHWHIKFRTQLSKKHVETILGCLTRYQLLTNDEANDFVQAYVYRYLDAEKELLLRLEDTCSLRETTSRIIEYIHSCPYNDILTHLYHFLTDALFADLRDPNNNIKGKNWVCYRDTEIVATSEYWARIEKAFTLQIANNILEQCPQITSPYLKERGQQFSSELNFFALKHRQQHIEHVPRVSQTYLAFLQGDKNTLQQKLERSKAYAGMQLA